MPTTYAGFTALPGGMNSGLNPLSLKATEFARGNNVSVRNGFVETRGGYVQEFDLTSFGTGFRGAEILRLNGGDWFVAVIGTAVIFYSFDLGTSYSFGGVFPAGTGWCYFEQADRWIVIQSGVDRPAVYEINALNVPFLYGRNPNAVSLVKATVMQYLHGRLFMVPVNVPSLNPDSTALPYAIPDDDLAAGPGRVTFCAADVRDNLNPEYLFLMSEHRIVAQGGVLTLPAESGFIEGMAELRGAATGTGVGPLIVFGREVVNAFDVAIPRPQWFSTNIGQVLFRGAGTKSSRGIVPVNDDLVYLDTEGQVRFMRYDKSQLAGSGGVLSNTPKSNEMRYWIGQQDLAYLSEVSATFSDNRFFWTLVGQSGPYYRALGVLDVAPAYTMAAQEPPAYYGVWTGFKFLQVLEARKSDARRMFCVVQARDTSLRILRYDPEAVTDPTNTPILSTVVTGVYNFAVEGKTVATQIKRLSYCEMWLGNLKRDTTIRVYYRPYGYPVWQSFGSKDLQVPGGPAQYRRGVKISLDLSTQECDDVAQKPLHIGDRFEFMIRWRGFARIEMFRVVADLVAEEDPDVCETDNGSLEEYPVDTLDPDFDYEVLL